MLEKDAALQEKDNALQMTATLIDEQQAMMAEKDRQIAELLAARDGTQVLTEDGSAPDARHAAGTLMAEGQVNPQTQWAYRPEAFPEALAGVEVLNPEGDDALVTRFDATF